MKRTLLALVLLTPALAACSDHAESSSTTAVARAAGTTATTTRPTSGRAGNWEIATPEHEGMDAAVLEGVKDEAFRPGKNTQGVVVVRHGRIVAEWYAPGSDADSWAASWSI